jgi:sRNA-binding protein
MSGKDKKRRMAKVGIELLAEKFPRCFAMLESRRRPLKIGIDQDILAALPDGISRHEIRRALRSYCGNAGYLRSMKVGVTRVGLDGNAAGTVTEDDMAHALAELAIRQAKAAKAAMTPKPDSSTPAAGVDPSTPHVQTDPQPRPASNQQKPRLGLPGFKRAG